MLWGPCEGGAQEKIPRLSAKQAPEKLEMKLRKVAEKDKSSDKKVQTKEKRRSKVKTGGRSQPRDYRLTCRKQERLETRRAQPLMKQGRKKPSLINITHPILSVASVSLLVQSRPEEYFYQLFCKCKIFSSSRNILKKEGIPIPLPPFFLRWNRLIYCFLCVCVCLYNSAILNMRCFDCLGVSLTFYRWGSFYIL